MQAGLIKGEVLNTLVRAVFMNWLDEIEIKERELDATGSSDHVVEYGI